MNYIELLKHIKKRVFVIAEAGVNHNGDVELARCMIDVALDAGADAVKFQTWITEKVYSPQDSIKAGYQVASTDETESEFEMVKKLELSFNAQKELKAYAEQQGILFLSTPDENESADFLYDELNLPIIKIASQDINNLPFLKYLAGKKLPIILSTGTANLTEVSEAIDTIRSRGNNMIFLLHCTSSYPAAYEEVNLNVIKTYQNAFGLPVGYSDHTIGLEVASAAVALGARIIEKHFTLSRDLEGCDQRASAEPLELKQYIEALKNVYRAMGDGYKCPTPTEIENMKAMRRFIVAGRDIKKGSIIREEDLLFQKVTHGLQPRYTELIVGRRAVTNIVHGQRIQLGMIDFGETNE